jgi:HEAT repeat protein
MAFIRIVMIIMSAGAMIATYIANQRKKQKQIMPNETPAITLPNEEETLIAALKDKNWRIRQAAARALGEMRSENALPELLYGFGDEDHDVREASQNALTKLGGVAIPGLIDVLDDMNVDRRIAAVEALVHIGVSDPRVVPALIHALNDESSWVRIPAVNALGKSRNIQTVNELARLLKDDLDSDVRKAAEKALSEIGTRQALNALKQT